MDINEIEIDVFKVLFGSNVITFLNKISNSLGMRLDRGIRGQVIVIGNNGKQFS